MLLRYVRETQEKVMIGAAYHAHRVRRAPLLNQHLSVRFNQVQCAHRARRKRLFGSSHMVACLLVLRTISFGLA